MNPKLWTKKKINKKDQSEQVQKKDQLSCCNLKMIFLVDLFCWSFLNLIFLIDLFFWSFWSFFDLFDLFLIFLIFFDDLLFDLFLELICSVDLFFDLFIRSIFLSFSGSSNWSFWNASFIFNFLPNKNLILENKIHVFFHLFAKIKI